MGYVLDLVNRFQSLRQRHQQPIIEQSSTPSDDEDDDEQLIVDETYTVFWTTNGEYEDMVRKLAAMYPFSSTNQSCTTKPAEKQTRHSTSMSDCVRDLFELSNDVRDIIVPGAEIKFQLVKPDGLGPHVSQQYNYELCCNRIILIFDEWVERLYTELQSVISILAIGNDLSIERRFTTADYVIALHRGSWHRAYVLYTVGTMVNYFYFVLSPIAVKITVRLIDIGLRCVVSAKNTVSLPAKYLICLPPKSLICRPQHRKWTCSEVTFRAKIVSSNLNKWYKSPHFDEPHIEIDDDDTSAIKRTISYPSSTVKSSNVRKDRGLQCGGRHVRF